MQLFFNFGEKIAGFDYLVINEREVRASAGLMFLFGIVSFFSVFILRTLLWVELFSITFIFEFFVRIVINPRYAPYMLLGSFIVSYQKPDWVEAKPKKFAWMLGMILGAIMTYYIVFDIITLLRFTICILCLVLLFLESSFGICLGCLLYQRLNIKLNNCAGGICEIKEETDFPKLKLLVFSGFILLFVGIYAILKFYKY